MVYQQQMEHDLLSGVSANDIHVIAGAPETGQILCYMTLRAITAPPIVTLRSENRPLFPVEQAFGWGVYNHLPILPDLPVARVLELSRFVKNHQLDARDERMVRSPAEMGVALYHILCASSIQQYGAVVGELEERVAKRNLDFFHMSVHGDDGAEMLAQLAEVPVEKIFLVQLADYFFEYSDRQADMIELARHQRLFPGEGLHDVRDLVQLLEDKGYRGHYTFEVFNDDYVNSDPMVIGQRAMKSARWISESHVAGARPADSRTTSP